MSRTVRLRNTGTGAAWNGVTLVSGTYYDIPESELSEWRGDSATFSGVGSGRLVVNDGTSDFGDPTAGWGWIQGEFGKVITAGLDPQGNIVENAAAPVTTDGETLTIQGNMANVTGNKLVNWTVSYTLGADESISERFIVPSGITVAIEFVQGYSSAVPFSAELNWYRGAGFRINPAIDPNHFAIQEVNGAHTTGDTVITLRNANTYQFSNLEINKRYAFATSTGKSCVRKVISKHSPTKTVTLSASVPFDMADGDKFALVDRPIARIGGDANNSLMDFEVSPSFKGDGIRFLELVIKNESLVDSGDVFAIVNGWTTATTGGTIPGAGGEAEVDPDA